MYQRVPYNPSAVHAKHGTMVVPRTISTTSLPSNNSGDEVQPFSLHQSQADGCGEIAVPAAPQPLANRFNVWKLL